MRRFLFFGAIVAFSIWAMSSLAIATTQAAPLDDLAVAVKQGRLDQAVYNQIVAGGSTKAIMSVDDPSAVRAIDQAKAAARIQVDTPAILQERTNVFNQLKTTATARAGGGVTVLKDFSHFPNQFVQFNSVDALAAVLQDTRVAVRENEIMQFKTIQTLPQIHQPSAAVGGFIGAGTTVAILDTEVNFTVSDLGSCTAVNAPAGTCRVVFRQDFLTAAGGGPGENDPHGTNVASISAKVAPGTQIAALTVFKEGAGAQTADIQDALNWTITNQATYNIVAANMSLGSTGSRNTSQCSASSYTAVYTNMRAAGILPVVAAGNSSSASTSTSAYTLFPGIASPACAPGAISVGAVYDFDAAITPGCGSGGANPSCFTGGIGWGSAASNYCQDIVTKQDKHACFSQTASYLTVLAPGPFSSAGGVAEGGTSQASPHVAGAVAVLRAASPSANVNTVEAAIHNTGRLLPDPRFGGGFSQRRLDLCDALTGLGINVNCTPTVVSPTVTNILATSADLGANVLDANGTPVTERGVVLALTSATNDPVIGGGGVTKLTAAAAGEGAFTVSALGLTTSSAYTWKGYATNSSGTQYTETSTFTPAATTAPKFISGQDTTFTFGTFNSFTVSATGTMPISLTLSSAIPVGGITFTDNGNGTATIAGTPTDNVSTRFSRTISANGTSVVNQTFRFSVLPASPPTIDEPTRSGMTGTTAVLGANVSADHGQTITARGFVYAKSSDNGNPLLGGANVTNITNGAPGLGSFTETVTGLLPSTSYTYRGYATNSAGTVYTSPDSLTTTGGAVSRIVNSDFNGDRKSDAGFFRPSITPNALWFSNPTGGGANFQTYFGAAGDIPASGDYDGDLRTDGVIFRPSTGLWFGPRTGGTSIVIQMILGQAGDIPVPCDYDGDGSTDAAFYRPTTGLWFGTRADGSTVVLNVNLGFQAGDIPTPADFNGDGRCDPAIMRPGAGPNATNLWFSLPTGGGAPFQRFFGAVGDMPAPGDYDGDGLADAAIFRPSTGLWYGLRTGSAATVVVQLVLGQNGDFPVPGDYDGNGTIDPAIYRPSTGLFYGMNAAGNTVLLNVNPGVAAGDVPTGKRPSLPGVYPYSTPLQAPDATRATPLAIPSSASRATPVPANSTAQAVPTATPSAQRLR